MSKSILQRGVDLLFRRQTNIISAAYVIMATIIFSQILGIFRQRLLVSIFGASNILGVYLAASKLPDLLFQVIVAGALSSAFIPVFSDYLTKGDEHEANKMALNFLVLGLFIFLCCSILLIVFAPVILILINPGGGFSPKQMEVMANLMRVIVFSQFLFIIAIFFTALLQSHNLFFIPCFASAMSNLGIIIVILIFSTNNGIFAPAYGMILGALLFIAIQVPIVLRTGFTLKQ